MESRKLKESSIYSDDSDWLIAHPEKRHHRRLDVSLDVDVIIDGQKISMTATNISCGGMFLHSPQNPFKDNCRAQVTLSLPGYAKPVRLSGELARYQQEPIEGSEGIAIKFGGLYDDNILAIDRFIKSKLH